jgi:hypothetical protein
MEPLSSAALFLVLMAGQPTYGISRTVDLKGPPNIECIRETLKGTPGVKAVRDIYPDGVGGKLWSFRYKGENVWGTLTVRHDSKGGYRFLDERLNVSQKPSAEELDKTAALMLAVEKRLITECKMPELEKVTQRRVP